MISMISAMARNRVIGRDGGLPWRLPDEMKHFVRTTANHPVIMGRRTFEENGGLPRRPNYVVTSRIDFAPDGVTVVRSLAEALSLTAGADERFIIGGARMYAEGLDVADRLYLTYVHAEVEGDTFFPEFDEAAWKEIDRVEHAADAKHDHAFSIVTYERR